MIGDKISIEEMDEILKEYDFPDLRSLREDLVSLTCRFNRLQYLDNLADEVILFGKVPPLIVSSEEYEKLIPEKWRAELEFEVIDFHIWCQYNRPDAYKKIVELRDKVGSLHVNIPDKGE